GAKVDKGSLRFFYPQQARMLEALLEEGSISTLERVDLSACYIRLQKFDKALEVLEGANQGHFLVQANLAIAHLELGDLRQAGICQRKALSLWPKATTYWGTAELDFYRRCDQALLRLIESRQAESRLGNPP